MTGTSRVPFNDLARGTSAERSEIDAAIGRVLDRGWYALGPENTALEAELAAEVGTTHAVLVASGSDALQLAMQALGAEAGSLILTAANAGGYSSVAAKQLHAIPVYADVDPISLLLTPDTLASACVRMDTMPRIAVITHLYGAAADMSGIMDWAEHAGVHIIEDCAQALGAWHAGARVGSFGDAATVSFYPTKNLGALGDGGAVLSNDDDVARTVRSLRQYGWSPKYRVVVDGGRNSRMDEVQAAVVRARLPHLDAVNERRRAIHRRYETALEGHGTRMLNTAGPGFIAHLAVLQTADRDRAIGHLSAAGIATDVHYPVPDHRQPVAPPDAAPLPITERASEQVLSIPLFPELTDAEIEIITERIGELP
jgi:dTDP-3-amino-2,3,6-trideoxy-4-keto-D-glucose/dTDP-3-amino-3,4,6-trideoxy-alpha-D-glucose/dTDP-2,6-dideoxy-D-kanosamine transaminase